MGVNRTGWRHTRGDILRQCAGIILLAGLGLAAYVYATSPDAPAEGVGYVTEGGASFEVLPTDSRSYQRNLEFYGGKSAVLMVELRQWWAGLWQGSALALLIACATVLAALGCLYAAREEPSAQPSKGPNSGKYP